MSLKSERSRGTNGLCNAVTYLEKPVTSDHAGRVRDLRRWRTLSVIDYTLGAFHRVGRSQRWI